MLVVSGQCVFLFQLLLTINSYYNILVFLLYKTTLSYIKLVVVSETGSGHSVHWCPLVSGPGYHCSRYEGPSAWLAVSLVRCCLVSATNQQDKRQQQERNFRTLLLSALQYCSSI